MAASPMSEEVEGFGGCDDGEENKAAFEGTGIDCLGGNWFVFCGVCLVFYVF